MMAQGAGVQPPKISPSGDLGQIWPTMGPGAGLMGPGMAIPGQPGNLMQNQKMQQQGAGAGAGAGGGSRNVAALDSFQMFKKQAHEREARVST